MTAVGPASRPRSFLAVAGSEGEETALVESGAAPEVGAPR